MSYFGKRWWTSKTVWANVLVVVLGVLQTVQEWLSAGDVSPAGVTLLLIGLTNVFLRFVTTEGIS
jgi:hypothetical protein